MKLESLSLELKVPLLSLLIRKLIWLFLGALLTITDCCLMGSLSAETENELARDIGGYDNIWVLRNIKVVDELVIDRVKQLPRGTVAGDCILLTIPNLLFFSFSLESQLGSLTGFSS